MDETLPSLRLSGSLQEFMAGVREVCVGGQRVKQVALQGAQAEHQREQHKQDKKQQSNCIKENHIKENYIKEKEKKITTETKYQQVFIV